MKKLLAILFILLLNGVAFAANTPVPISTKTYNTMIRGIMANIDYSTNNLYITITNYIDTHSSGGASTNGLWARVDGTNYVDRAVTNSVTVTNGLASIIYLTNYTDTAGYTNRTITNGLASTIYVANAVTNVSTNGLASTIYVANAVTNVSTNGLASTNFIDISIQGLSNNTMFASSFFEMRDDGHIVFKSILISDVWFTTNAQGWVVFK